MDKSKETLRDAVTFIILRPDGKILMHQRDDGNGKKILYPNMWGMPGGRKEEGESHIETVIREIQEEFRLTVKPEQCELILIYDHDGDRDQIFVCQVEEDVNPELHEGRNMQWMTMAEIKKIQLAWQFDKILPQLEKSVSAILKRKG